MKRCCLVLSIIGLSSCATIPSRYTDFTVANPCEVAAERLLLNAKKCWAREATPFVDGKLVRAKRSIEGYIEISEHDFASDLGVNAPKTVMRLEDNDGECVVVLTQREISGAIKAKDEERDKFWEDANRWLKGDDECS